MILTEEHINYIIKDISYRGIVDEDLGEELVDHICTLLEKKMDSGVRFIEAYDEIVASFGRDKKLVEVQKQAIEYTNNNTKIMVKNYFKIALRNLVKHKFYAGINIFGLSVGVACSLLIYLFVSHETSFDNFHKDSDQIYRIVRHGKFNGNEFHYPVCPAPMAGGLVSELPEIEQAVRFRSLGTYLVKTPEATESFKEDGLIFTDSTFFDLFSFDVIQGDANGALVRPNTIAISRSAATKYFPNGAALSKTLVLDGDQNFEITAVFADMPKNAHFQFDFLMSMSSLEEANNAMWLSNNFFTYIRSVPGLTQEKLTEKVSSFYGSKADPELQKYMGITIEEFLAAGNSVSLELQPLDQVYLTSDFVFDIGRSGSLETVYLFSAIAIFILGLACINFMNLSTARSANRAKEVGVRKALGSFKKHLIRQFLVESVLLSLVAYALGIFLVLLIMPLFNQLSGKELTLPLSEPIFIFTLLIAALTTGVLAGLYPAFFLSSFKPINTLKGKIALGSGNSRVRSGLVVFQFFVSILLIIGTIAVDKQLKYIQNKKIGFNKEQVLLVNDAYMLGDSRDAFKEEVAQLGPVVSSSFSGFIPVNGYNRNDNTYWKKGLSPDESNTVNSQMWSVDYDYVKTMGMEIIKGRDFDKDIASDSGAVILNEEAMREFGFDQIDGNAIQTYGFDGNTGKVLMDQFNNYKIIGVVRDFHFESLKEDIAPLALQLERSTSVMSVRLSTNDFANSIDLIEEKWKKFGTGLPFNYNFLDDEFANMYRAESRLAKIFGIFAGLAILIGCLGLFALATFMAEQRTKEIGIRKVLGASISGIVLMLSKEFSKLVIIAFIIAVPVAWWGISNWLANYNYRIGVGLELFIISGVIAFVIAWLTVGYQSVKAAARNPVKSLRSE